MGTGLLSAWLGHVFRVCPHRHALLSRSPRSGCFFFLEPLPRRSEVLGWGSAGLHGLTAAVALPRKAVSCAVRVAGPVGTWEPLLECSTEFHVVSTETLLGAAGPALQTLLGAGAAAGSFPVGTRNGVEERSGQAPTSVLHIFLSTKISGCSCWFGGTLSFRGNLVGRLADTSVCSDGWSTRGIACG